MNKWSIRIFVAIVVSVALWYVGRYYCNTALRHRTEINYMKALAKRIRHYKSDDVRRVTIITPDGVLGVELDPKKDRADIRRLMNSLKRITVEDRERGIGMTSILIVELREPVNGFRGFRIEGDFDPDHAPVITRSMRSDDLGRIVYDIFRSKGLEPRKGKPER